LHIELDLGNVYFSELHLDAATPAYSPEGWKYAILEVEFRKLLRQK